MAGRFASSQKALGVCDICGFTYKLRELRNIYKKGRDTNTRACPECWDEDHPQLKIGEFPVNDAQALLDPRPDYNQYAASRATIEPVKPVVGTGFIGQATVQIS